jgi:hypothetical protein
VKACSAGFDSKLIRKHGDISGTGNGIVNRKASLADTGRIRDRMKQKHHPSA